MAFADFLSLAATNRKLGVACHDRHSIQIWNYYFLHGLFGAKVAMPDMQQLAESKERALVCKEEYWERFLSFCAAMRNVCGGVPADMDATFSSLSEGSASYAQIAHLHAAYCKLAPALISRGSTHFVRSHVSTEGARLAPVAEKDMVALGRFHWSATALSSHCDPVVLANCVVTPLEMLLLMFALRMRTKAQIKHRG
eukprot:CAMPEP_0173218500 /NCGR_PEP_ID=MMETSP1142-20121109/1086_1 /TAXON_ID=483371 /ORGANISM="non described non described, Strain CCMP2298" /LENGTH=196 /DNA_ID=CAMNT_0014146199 /DNA_START=1 /DNA_END=587 /DNA_ORIENTATION=-